MPRRRAGAVLTAFLAVAAGVPMADCAPHAAGGQPVLHVPHAQAASDSAVGVVRVTGVDPLPQVELVPEGGAHALTLDGPSALRRLSGLQVAVAGTRDGTRFAVSRFVVRSANGVLATDGVLAADGGTIMLVTADGVRHALVNPSPLLRANVGHRAWVAGPLESEPVSFGIIE